MNYRGKLYVVATPIGNLSDLSQRAQSILSHVTWVAAEDTRHSRGLLDHLGLAPTLIAYHEHNERECTLQLIERLERGEDGALISDAGTPLISDPGYLLVSAMYEKGLTVVPIPGPCAVITALSVSGLPTDRFLFEGFLPAKSSARCQRLEALKAFAHTMVFYEAPHRILDLVQDIQKTIGDERRLFLARELTKKFESLYLGTVSDLLGRLEQGAIPQKGEFVAVLEGWTAPKQETTEEEEMIRTTLHILMPELPLKQAVSLAVKLTGFSKNRIYDCALKIQSIK